MATDGIAAVQARIAHIEQLIGLQRVQQPTAPAAVEQQGHSRGSLASEAFASVLQRVSNPSGVDPSKFPNGKIPDHALVSIGGGEKLVPSAAEKFLQMRASAERAGVKIGINDSYRSYDEQVHMANTKGLYSQGGLAAKPGTSTHGLGLSVDLQLDSKALNWMRQNAKQFGFVNDVKNESWHWTYKG